MKNSEKFKIDKTHFSIGKLEDQGDEIQYWKDKTHTERLQAIELIRQMQYGYNPDTERLHHIFEVVNRT